jgi:hypothetical protein
LYFLIKLTDVLDARITLDDTGLGTDAEHSDGTISPAASTILNTSTSGPATEELSPIVFNSDVSDDEANFMSLYTDIIEEGEPAQPQRAGIVPRKEVIPVGILSVCTHGRY